MNKLGPIGPKLLYDLCHNENSRRGNPGQGRFGRGSQGGQLISLLECIEHLEASDAGNDSIGKVAGTPNGVPSVTTGRGEARQTG